MSAAEETITLLRRIATAVEKIAAVQTAPAPGAVAPDSDLDGQYGDPEIRRDPKRWVGAPMAPCRMSEGSPEWLDCLASFFDWQADHAEPWGEKTAEQIAGYRRRDAARARGWAARLRKSGAKPKRKSAPVNDGFGANESEAEAQASAFDDVEF